MDLTTIRTGMLALATTGPHRALSRLPSRTALLLGNATEGAVDMFASSSPSCLPARCTVVLPAHDSSLFSKVYTFAATALS